MIALTNVDKLILSRWQEVIGLQESFDELEDRLGRRLEEVSQQLTAWAAEQGYQVVGVDKKYAELQFARNAWRSSGGDTHVWLIVGGLYPYGFRRVDADHPYIWVYVRELDKDSAGRLQGELRALLGDRAHAWLHEDCNVDQPFGRYLEAHSDLERATLAVDFDALRGFVQTHATEVMKLGSLVDRALAKVIS